MTLARYLTCVPLPFRMADKRGLSHVAHVYHYLADRAANLVDGVRNGSYPVLKLLIKAPFLQEPAATHDDAIWIWDPLEQARAQRKILLPPKAN